MRASRADLLAPLNIAWWKLSEDSDAMKEFLRADEPRFSVIAAFALAQSLREADHAELVEAYELLHNEDVLWGIATALEGLDVHLAAARGDRAVDGRREDRSPTRAVR